MAGKVVVCMDGDLISMHFDMARGHLAPTVRRSLVEHAFGLPEFRSASRQVHATIPLGDVELLHGLQARLTDVSARAAGATCLIEATTV